MNKEILSCAGMAFIRQLVNSLEDRGPPLEECLPGNFTSH